MRTGAAGVIVGYGSTSGVTTSDEVLGISVPMATAIADAAAARREYLDETGGRYVHVLADGDIHTSGDLAKAIACGADAMVLLSSPLIAPNVQVLAELAFRHRLPAITLFPDFARAGGLLAYGPNLLSMYQLVGVLAGKIARGADPAALPIERPTKFETVLNSRTAQALGVSIPVSLMMRVDEVIE